MLNKKLNCAVLSLAALLFSVTVLHSAVPKLINFQGKLMGTNDKAATGTKSMAFKIFTQSTGGSAIWSETQNIVLDSFGLYNVLLGEQTPLNISFDTQYWLEVAVDGETMSPRYKIAATAYSFYSTKAGSVDWSDISNRPSGLDDGDDIGVGGTVGAHSIGNFHIIAGTITVTELAANIDASGIGFKAYNSDKLDGKDSTDFLTGADFTQIKLDTGTLRTDLNALALSTGTISGGAGDNLGNHIATTTLNMGNNAIDLAGSGAQGGSINMSGDGHLTGDIRLTADTAGGGNIYVYSYNLVGGTAGGTLNVAGGSINLTREVNGIGGNISFGSGGPFTAGNITGANEIHAAYLYGDGTNITGISGDNLGNHIATTTLNMGGFDITNVGKVDGYDLSAQFNLIGASIGSLDSAGIAQIKLDTGTLRTDLNTVAANFAAADLAVGVDTGTLRTDLTTLALSTGAISGSDNLGNHIATTTLNMNTNLITGVASLTATGSLLFSGWSFGTIPLEGAGTRLMWYTTKSAFRAGYVDGTQWDNVNVGNYSSAMGSGTTASGQDSTAMGSGTTASGDHSTAMGQGTTAGGYASTAMGKDTAASGGASAAMGQGTTAGGEWSTSMGYFTTASGNWSTAMGKNTTASNTISIAMGWGSTAAGPYSTAIGSAVVTENGTWSIGAGQNVRSDAANNLVLGSGVDAANPLLNNTANSLMIGFNRTTPALFVSQNAVSIDNTSMTAGLNVSTINAVSKISFADGTVMISTSGFGGGTGAGDNLGNHIATTTLNMNTNPVIGVASMTATGSLLFSGNVGAIPATGGGTRLMWYPAKSAFRAGYVDGTQWNDTNIYPYSFAVGYNTISSNTASVAMGYQTSAGGFGSIAMGVFTNASENNSTAMGYGTNASGVRSTAMGQQTTSSGLYSTAMGFLTTAGGDASIAMGAGSTANGYHATAMGDSTFASGRWSTAMGYNTTASADNTIVLGKGIDDSNRIDNNIADSLMVGFDSTSPMLFVSSASVSIGNTSMTAGLNVSTINAVSKISFADGTVMTSTSGFGGGTGAGDNLGNHIATTTLNMNNNQITNISAVTAAGDIAYTPAVDRNFYVQMSTVIGVGGRNLTIRAGDVNSGSGFAELGGTLTVQAGMGLNATQPGKHGGDLILRSGANLTSADAGLANGGSIILQTGGANQSYNERMRITETGNIGIGTSAPNSVLAVTGAISLPIVTKTADYTATANDSTILVDASGGAVTISLPTAVGIAGRIYTIKKVSISNSVIIDPNGSETIDGSPTKSINSPYDAFTCQSDGANWVIIEYYRAPT